MPFHTAQLALHGIGEDQVHEASWVVQSVAGASAYVHGIDLDRERFIDDVNRIVEFVRSKSSAQPSGSSAASGGGAGATAKSASSTSTGSQAQTPRGTPQAGTSEPPGRGR